MEWKKGQMKSSYLNSVLTELLENHRPPKTVKAGEEADPELQESSFISIFGDKNRMVESNPSGTGGRASCIIFWVF